MEPPTIEPHTKDFPSHVRAPNRDNLTCMAVNHPPGKVLAPPYKRMVSTLNKSLRFTYSRNVRVKGITSVNSQKFHISFNYCQNVAVDGAQVIAADEGPNTDGIHIENCRNVEITNSRIKTGDDCISIGPGSKTLWIQGIRCGPGHGISIGSLARDAEEEGVQNVTVLGTLFARTTNGLRIKSWARASTGFVRGIRFIGAVMSNVQNPIIIDQNYYPDNVGCPGDVSSVGIKDVVYQNVRGKSATEVAVRLDCSGKVPCRGIRLQNVNLKYVNREKEAKTVCVNAFGRRKLLASFNPEAACECDHSFQQSSK